ncbi:MAG: response regulator [Candidatus Eisenbacteria bacterium]
MNGATGNAREIAAGLVRAVRPALGAEAAAVTRLAARDVAQVLGLDGLDAALAVLEHHAGPRRPREVGLLAARIERLLHQAEHDGDVRVVREAGAELTDYAAHLSQAEWGHAAEEPARAPLEHVHAAADVLADLPVEPASLERARLTARVASALRAALDWAGFDVAPRLQAQVHDSAFTLTAAAGHESGLGPAAAVLATVEGSLLRESDGRWTMRVPLHAERGSFLLVRQGRLAIALPWHSVARLRMLAPGAERSLAEPVLAPFASAAPGDGERPAALVALGLARAWLVADRIVWRVAADPVETLEQGPFAAPAHVVTLEGDDRYWVADAAFLLRTVEPVAVAAPAPRARATAAATPAVVPAHDAPLPVPHAAEPDDAAAEDAAGTTLADAVARAIELLREERPALAATADAPLAGFAPSTPRYSARITVVAPADEWPELARTEAAMPPAAAAPAVVATPSVVAPPPVAAPIVIPPLEAPVALASPAPSAPPAPRAERPSVAAERHPARRALVADDSLVARLFLARMLERRGYVVETVGDGAALFDELSRGPWALVCADFAMPDAYGRAHVERLLDHRVTCREPYTLVVLTRDEQEDVLARDAGAALLLRKPFDNDDLDALLTAHAGPDGGESRT